MIVLRYLILIVAFIPATIASQICDTTRYKKAVFSDVQVHKDVKYGEAQVWNFPYNNTDLNMDIYEPIGDSITRRPLMIWVHPGGFLTGSKEADDMVALCDSFAKRGYVTASISYRLGFNPTSSASGERAVYRGVQDTRAAIRFLKEHHQTYGIDTNYTFLGGSSAGAFATLHTAYLEQHEAPSSYEGGIASPNLGCLDCSGNNYQHGINLSGIVNLWGALGDSNWVSPQETVPSLHIHGTADNVVPFGIGHPFGVFTTPLVNGSRTIVNQLNALGITNESYFVTGEGHEFHGTSNGDFNDPPTPYWDTIFDKISTHYYEILRPDIQLNLPTVYCQDVPFVIETNAKVGEKVCIHSQSGNIISNNGDSIAYVFTHHGWDTLEIILFSKVGAASEMVKIPVFIEENPQVAINWSVVGNGAIHFQPSQQGFVNYIWQFGDGNGSSNMQPQHSYQEAGIYHVSLSVKSNNGCVFTTTTTIDLTDLSIKEAKSVKITVYPNPFNDHFILESNQPIKQAVLYNQIGSQLSIPTSSSTTNQIFVCAKNLPKGIYLLKLTDINGNHITEKLIKF